MDNLKGRTGTTTVSAFVKFLQLIFRAEIDVQVGNGRLRYINGYVAKGHDAVDVGLGEYAQKGATAPLACHVSTSQQEQPLYSGGGDTDGSTVRV